MYVNSYNNTFSFENIYSSGVEIITSKKLLMQKSKQFSVKKANKFPEYHIFTVVNISLVNTLNATPCCICIQILFAI